MGIEYDPHEFVCCGNKLHRGTGLSCCGQQAFNPDIATCCEEGQGSTFTANVTQGLSGRVSACCGLEAYNPLNEICCNSTVVAKPVPMAECCGKGAFDVENQRCCGPNDDKKIVTMASTHHQCCGHTQYDTMSQCCCWMNRSSQIQPIHSNCCPENSAQIPQHVQHVSTTVSQLQKSTAKATLKSCGKGFDAGTHLCCGPFFNKKILTRKSSDHRCCGHEQYDPKTERCCWHRGTSWRQPLKSCCCATVSGHCDSTPTIFNPLTHICRNGCVSVRKPWMDQCCGQVPYGLAQRSILCCNGTLYKDREDGEECSEIGIPYNPAKGTMCCSQLHGSPGQHCCGTELYQPHSEICCDGHRHRREEHRHCCGIRVYNVNDPQMKCCGGTLYNLTSLGKSGPDALCCGSILQKELNQVCCSSEDTELLYSNKRGYQCCGHMYYNISLWSCCAGKLSPVQPGQHLDKMTTECTFLSVNNLNKIHLCNKIKIGTIQSVSPHSIVFNTVLEIQGTQATVEALPSPYMLQTPNHCIIPKLTPGKTYFFDEAQVFSDFNHNSLQSIYFIMSKCFHS
ncbi:uncharacterized protein si:ch211-195m9.3 isoform X1 [Solea solea]|uniref:uncharacterized protein si:ch211-195m9.3 isoform X1 n=1 Tax=Solea solea TaxID=90069 RepID=UPI00272B78DE|nr:uncharacterized protein si:ch211-195m9.3 isoform X1 [Solea solea]